MTAVPGRDPYDDSFVMECARQLDRLADELWELPWWAWIRRRRIMGWRRHYSGRIADEMVAWRRHLMESL